MGITLGVAPTGPRVRPCGSQGYGPTTDAVPDRRNRVFGGVATVTEVPGAPSDTGVLGGRVNTNAASNCATDSVSENGDIQGGVRSIP